MDEHGQNRFYCRGFAPSAPACPPPSRSPGPGWERPGDLPWPDTELRRAWCDSQGAYCLWEESGGFCLAYPLSCRLPFPLVPLFCFARVRCLSGRLWWVFSFDSEGQPRMEDA